MQKPSRPARPLKFEYWMLPEAPFKVKLWERIPRTSRYLPFGYEIDPENEDWLNPISKELELLELAKKHLKSYSYRSITHDGLKKRVDVERKRKRLTTIKRKFADRLQKALREIQILETERVGYYSCEGSSSSHEDTSRT